MNNLVVSYVGFYLIHHLPEWLKNLMKDEARKQYYKSKHASEKYSLTSFTEWYLEECVELLGKSFKQIPLPRKDGLRLPYNLKAVVVRKHGNTSFRGFENENDFFTLKDIVRKIPNNGKCLLKEGLDEVLTEIFKDENVDVVTETLTLAQKVQKLVNTELKLLDPKNFEAISGKSNSLVRELQKI